MKVSELIAVLQAKQAEHGDVVAGIVDADTGWTLEITSVDFDKQLGCIDVAGDYGDRITVRRT
jgi:hypothetical protein